MKKYFTTVVRANSLSFELNNQAEDGWSLHTAIPLVGNYMLIFEKEVLLEHYRELDSEISPAYGPGSVGTKPSTIKRRTKKGDV